MKGPEQRLGDDPQDHADRLARTFVPVAPGRQGDHQGQKEQGVPHQHHRDPGPHDEPPHPGDRLDDPPADPPQQPGLGRTHHPPRERIEDLALAGGGQVAPELGGEVAQAFLGVAQGQAAAGGGVGHRQLSPLAGEGFFQDLCGFRSFGSHVRL
jgi:hypothetical protein